MRLIDADALLKQYGLETADKYTDEGINREAFDTRSLYEIKDMIDDALTVDAVPVVRCKNCVWWEQDDEHFHACLQSRLITRESDFCSYGERKEDEP